MNAMEICQLKKLFKIRTKGKSLILSRHSMSILTEAICILYLSVIFTGDDGLNYKLRCDQEDLQKWVTLVWRQDYKNPKSEYKTNDYISVKTSLMITLS